jgi:nucleoid-associated protein YgaU
MTSEAKIGLLIGLVSIFLIAFIINGIPISHKTDNNKLSANMVSFENTPPGLAAKERRIQQVFESAKPTEQTQLASTTPPIENNNLSVMALSSPPATSVATNLAETAATVPAHPLTASAQPLAAAVEKTDIKVGATSSPQVKPSASSSPTVYVVIEGDNLGTIAKKVYGHSEKNNIIRLFQANRSTLKSSDEIYVGQKLVIPPLPVSQMSKNKLEKSSSPTLLEETKLINQKNAVPTAKDTRSVPQGTAHDSGRAKEENRSYIVQQGDSLWQIAAKHLGDGSRYQEIVELNAGTLENEDSLAVGMCLKLPK